MSRPARILAVTLGLVAVGAVLGALAGAVALAIGLLITEGAMAELFVLNFTALIGAAVGAITAPVLAWLFLRHVSLGRMFVGASGGTVLGGVIGWIAPLAGNQIESALIGAFTGCLLAAASLRRQALVRATRD